MTNQTKRRNRSWKSSTSDLEQCPEAGKELVDANICNWRHGGVAATAERACRRYTQADRKEARRKTPV